MNIAILGAGNIGKALAPHLARLGHSVKLTSSRPPEQMADETRALGKGIEPARNPEAVQWAEWVVLAVPWPDHRAALEGLAFDGKLVVDAMNPYTRRYPETENLHGRTSSDIVREEIGNRTRLVKAFNTIQARYLAGSAKPKGAPDRIAIPLCGDETAAKEMIGRLIDEIGFDPVDIGPLANGRFSEPFQALYDKNYTAEQVRHEMQRFAGAAGTGA